MSLLLLQSAKTTGGSSGGGIITAAQVSADGVYLLVRHTASLSTGSGAAGTPSAFPFTDFSLTPNSSPKMRLSISRPGYIRSSGQAQAASRTKQVVGLQPVRLPVQYDPPTSKFTVPTFTANGASDSYIPNNIPLDQVDNGDGTITVRFTLSQRLHYNDTGVTLSVSSGWRTGAPAQSGVAVDMSLVQNVGSYPPVHPLVVLRPADVPWRVVGTADFQWDDVIAAHYPEGFEAVCAVKYWLTDGTNNLTGGTASVWVTGARVSTQYGDNFKTWGATLNANTAGLNAGPIYVMREVYPWTGAMRSFTTTGGGLTLALGTSTVCERAVPLLYDPAGTRFPQAYVVLDPTGGSATASSAMVGTGADAATALAAAQAVGTKALDISTAVRAIQLLARTTGGNAQSVDGANIVIPADTTAVIGTTTVNTGLTNVETWLNIIGDPALSAAAARARCFINAPSVAPQNLRSAHFHWQNLTVNGSSNILQTGDHWFDNVTITGGTAAPFTAIGGIGTAKSWFTNLSVSGLTAPLSNGNIYTQLIRNVQTTHGVSAITTLNLTRTTGGTSTNVTLMAYPNLLDGDALADQIYYNVNARGTNSTNAAYILPIKTNTGTTPNLLARMMNINVLVETYASNTSVYSPQDSDRPRDTIDCLWEGCLLVGNRLNGPYDEMQTDTASFTASITSNVMTVTAVSSGSLFGSAGTSLLGITVGSTVYAAGGVTVGVISSLGTGVGGVGTYNITAADLASQALTSGNLSQIASVSNTALGNVWRNTITDKRTGKSDVFQAPIAQNARGFNSGTGLQGYAQARVKSWSLYQGQNHFGYVDMWRFAAGTLGGGVNEGYGLGFKVNPNNNSAGGNTALTLQWPKFTADGSFYGTAAGFGDYRPSISASSPLLNSSITDANTDKDLAGVTRGSTFAFGPLEGA